MGVLCLVPEMGPFPLEDTMGMMAAAAILDRSLDPGFHEEYVQWDTFRGARLFLTNATQAGVSGLSDSVGSYERNRMWISGVVTHSFWFTRFMSGIHKRVGEVKIQDKPITIDVIKQLEWVLTREWDRAERPENKRRVAEMGVWFIAGFCSGLRGEEMLLIEYAGTAASLKHLGDPVCPHVTLVVSGRTKGNQLGGAKFGVPIAARTEINYLMPGKWVERLCGLMKAQGDTKGRLFRRDLTPSKLGEYEFDFFRLLRVVQSTTSFIDKTIELEAKFGILRSLRRGMTSHARNMRVAPGDLQAFNRWSKALHSATGAMRLDMMETYSSLDSIKPTMLRVTRAF
jgi:hypothetical protein